MSILYYSWRVQYLILNPPCDIGTDQQRPSVFKRCSPISHSACISELAAQTQMVPLMDWRGVIHHYLMACVEDSRRVSLPKSRIQFIDEHGTTALKLCQQEKKTRSDKLVASQQVPLPEMYKVIEESPTRVLAEVEKANLLELFRATRFLVVNVDNQWKLDDTFSNCVCKTGGCFGCESKGYCRVCEGRGLTRRFFSLMKQECFLCHGKPKCKFCDGTGRCDLCSQSPIPGWRSVTRIPPEDKMRG